MSRTPRDLSRVVRLFHDFNGGRCASPLVPGDTVMVGDGEGNEARAKIKRVELREDGVAVVYWSPEHPTWTFGTTRSLLAHLGDAHGVSDDDMADLSAEHDRLHEATTHAVTTTAVRDRLWRAVCSCGWSAEASDANGAAGAGREHLEEAMLAER